MPVRLSVIMVHSPPPSTRQVPQDQKPKRASPERMAEAVVGELIGLSGIDLTLVGPIAQLPEASTDRLTLESLSGDVAVLDWQSPPHTLAALASIGFQGERSPHACDRNVAAPPANLRRIYAFDLNEFSQSSDVIEALSQLKSSRQVRTFSLDLAPRTTTLPDAKTQAGSAARAPRPNSPRKHSDAKAISGESLNLDDLLDQLDQLDP